jgi:hypothetical protein
MKTYYDKELSIKMLEREIDIKKAALLLFDDVKKIVGLFNGKIANARLDTALKKLNENLNFKMEYNGFRITYDEYDYKMRYVSIGDKGAYIKNCSVNIAWCTISSAYGDSALDDDRKIIAYGIMKAIDAQAVSLKREIAIMEAQLLKIDEIISRYRAIAASIRAFNDEIDHDIREYFDLKIDNVY